MKRKLSNLIVESDDDEPITSTTSSRHTEVNSVVQSTKEAPTFVANDISRIAANSPFLHYIKKFAKEPHVLKEHDTLQEAFLSIKGKSGFKVWSKEISSKGSRKFLTATTEKFFEMYEKIPIKHFYEVIGTDSNVKMYFDIDIVKEKTCSTEFDGVKKNVDDLLKSLSLVLAASGYSADQIGRRFVFESCDDAKMSYHVIYPNINFENMRALKKKIDELYDIAVKSEMEFAHLNFGDRKANLGRTPLILLNNQFDDFFSVFDLNVYHPNQSLRLFGSQKYGSTRVKKRDGVPLSFIHFVESLVSGCVEVNDSVSSGNVDASAASPTKSLKPDAKFSEIVKEAEKLLISKYGNFKFTYMEYPSRPDGQKYGVFASENKNCEIAGKNHDKNHVYYVVDLVNRRLYQKCYNTLCKGLKGDMHQF